MSARHAARHFALTPAEAQTLALARSGCTLDEIAALSRRSKKAAERHRTNARAKAAVVVQSGGDLRDAVPPGHPWPVGAEEWVACGCCGAVVVFSRRAIRAVELPFVCAKCRDDVEGRHAAE